MIQDLTKKCCRCKENKPLTEFTKSTKESSGYAHACKICVNTSRRLNRIINKTSILKRENEYLQRNKDRIACYKRDWVNKNREKYKKSKSDYYQMNKSSLSLKRRNYHRTRRQCDPMYRLLCNYRTRINHALKGYTKSNKTLVLCGCTITELKLYLESKFLEGMTWENYGKWHVDHIIPCVIFNLSDSIEQKQCFHYTNLQPLWAEDNLSKSDKIMTIQ